MKLWIKLEIVSQTSFIPLLVHSENGELFSRNRRLNPEEMEIFLNWSSIFEE